MPLYLLKRTKTPKYDEYTSKLVRAKNVYHARQIANVKTGDEGRIWDDLTKVSCERILVMGSSKVILSDFNAG